MLDSTSSALAAAEAVQYAAYTSGNGSEADPYVLASSSDTITLETGKWYVLPDGASIGTVVTNEYNSSKSTGGINVNGAHLDIQTSASVAGTINMGTSGSILVLENTSGKWAYQANMPGADLSAGGDQFYTYPSLQNATITNFGSGSGICAEDVPGGYGTLGIASTTASSGSSLVLKHDTSISVTDTPADPGGKTLPGYISVPVTVGANYPLTYFHTDPNNSCQIDGCFLTGTHILTRDGEKPVETLVAGDEIAVLVNDTLTYHPLSWLGRSHADVSRLDFEQDAYPVRIHQDAFGSGMPHRDLLVTSEHCIYIDGQFVPVRMLVNNRSIVIDRSIPAYDFYHVELDEHAVIVSEGLFSESYLDTGNRGTFENSVIRSMRPHFAGGIIISGGKNWENDAAAPLVTAQDKVEPIWNQLASRAKQLGFDKDSASEAAKKITDPDLRLVTRDGREIRPVRHTDHTYCFMVPANVDSVRIASNITRPSDAIGPFCDDRRKLGVLIGNVCVTNGRDRQAVTVHKSRDAVDGWHNFEGGIGRWTAGNALLTLGQTSGGLFAKMVEIEVLSAGPYLVRNTGKTDIQVA